MPSNSSADPVERNSVGSAASLSERPQLKITRKHTIVYPSAEAPHCPQCETEGLRHFNFSECSSCMELLRSDATSVPQILAMLRHWNPVTQRHILMITNEILRRGSNVNDRDGLTDMSLLHYAARGGAIGDPLVAGQTVAALLDRGADLRLRCRWTDMVALHYAVFFDVPNVVEILLKAGKRSDVEATSNDFEGGTPLHIAAANLNVESAKLLVRFGANVNATDNLGRTPIEVIPSTFDPDLVPEDAVTTLRSLLRPELRDEVLSSPYTSISGRALLQSLGLKIGDQVVVSPNKIGILRYCGTIQFANGVWAGVELSEPTGKNDGSLAGVTYFLCAAGHGVFVPIGKVSRAASGVAGEGCSGGSVALNGASIASASKELQAPAARRERIFSFPKIDVSHVTSKVQTGLRSLSGGSVQLQQRGSTGVEESHSDPLQVAVGDRVLVGNRRKGVIRFLGETKFASGLWVGVELDTPQGKNDGAVNGVEYFKCPPAHGVFALIGRVRKLTAEDEDATLGATSSTVPAAAASDDSLRGTDGGDGTSPRSSAANDSDSSSRKSSVASQSADKEEYRDDDDELDGSDMARSATTLGEKNDKVIISTTLKKSCSWLKEGMKVFVQKELGILRYIGPVQFDEGTFLGVEFRQATGRHDGSVGGTRYFRCRPGHGVLVRPCSVNVRGINGAKLFEQKLDASETTAL